MANERDPKTTEPAADPRYELVFEPNLVAKGRRPRPRRGAAAPRPARSSASFASVLQELNGLRERGGAVLGDAYARAAKSFLERWEILEDRAAERRHSQRAQRRRAPAEASAAKTPSPAK